MELLYYSDPTYLYILIPIMLLSFLIQNKLKSKFKKFSQQTLSANLSGKEIAEKVIRLKNNDFSGKIVTKLSLLKNYCVAEEYHQKYLDKKF